MLRCRDACHFIDMAAGLRLIAKMVSPPRRCRRRLMLLPAPWLRLMLLIYFIDAFTPLSPLLMPDARWRRFSRRLLFAAAVPPLCAARRLRDESIEAAFFGCYAFAFRLFCRLFRAAAPLFFACRRRFCDRFCRRHLRRLRCHFATFTFDIRRCCL